MMIRGSDHLTPKANCWQKNLVRKTAGSPQNRRYFHRTKFARPLAFALDRSMLQITGREIFQQEEGE
jgi:hypothetical protein